MTNNYILCKLDAFRKNAFVVNFRLGLSLHGFSIVGRAKIDSIAVRNRGYRQEYRQGIKTGGDSCWLEMSARVWGK